MDLRSEVLKKHSKENTLMLLEWIGDDDQRVEQVVKLFLSEEYRIAQRASWLISELAEKNSRLLGKYLPEIITRMTAHNTHVAVKRNVLRSLQFVKIPSDLQGYVLDVCFSFLDDPKEGNVVQVFSMTVIEKLTEEYPELIPEFKCIIERNLENDPSPAFRNRASKTLIRLRKC